MRNFVEKFRKWMDELAEAMSNALSSMTMFWIITLLVIVPLFFTQPVGLVGWMQYIVSVFFQGVALPVLGYTAKLSGRRTDQIISKIEELSEKIDKRTESINNEVEKIDQEIEKIDEEVDHIIDDIDSYE
jgi:low affinity Fe/Cu permease